MMNNINKQKVFFFGEKEVNFSRIGPFLTSFLAFFLIFGGLWSCGTQYDVVSSQNYLEEETPYFSLGGTVSGLTGTLLLGSNHQPELEITENGSFQFSDKLERGTLYEVFVNQHPNGQTCTIDSGQRGQILGQNITNIEITCVDWEAAVLEVHAWQQFALKDGDTLEVGNALVGGSKPIELQISNTGNGPLEITAENPINISGTGANQFQLETGVAEEILLYPGESTTGYVYFEPQSSGVYLAALNIPNNAPGQENFSIALQAEGVDTAQPEIVLATASGEFLANNGNLSLGRGQLGSGSLTFDLVVINLGTAVLEDGGGAPGMALNTGSPGRFSVTPPCCVISEGESETFSVSFDTGSVLGEEGTYSTQLEIYSNDADENPFLLNLSGTSQDGQLEVRDSGGSLIADGGVLDLSSVDKDKGPFVFTLKLANTGDYPITMDGASPVTLGGTDPGAFSVTGIPDTIDGGTTVDISLEFNPTEIKTYNTQLTFQHDDTHTSPYTLDVNLFAGGIMGRYPVSRDGSGEVTDNSTVLANAEPATAINGNGVPSSVLATDNRFAQTGEAILFNGTTSDVSLGGVLPLQPELTLSTWVRLKNYSSSNQTLIAHTGTSADQMHYQMYVDPTGRLTGSIYDDAGAQGALCSSGNYRLPRRQWVHVAYVYRDGTGYCFANGRLTGTSGVFSGTLGGASNGTAAFGARYTGTWSEFLDGELDDIRVYGLAISQEEMGNLAAPIPDKLYGWLTLRGQTREITGRQVAKTTTGAPAFTGTRPTGENSDLLAFDGSDDMVTIGGGSQFNFTDVFTVAFWVRPAIAAGTNPIIGKYDSTGNTGWRIYQQDSGLRFAVGDGASETEVEVLNAFPGANIWIRVIASYNKGTGTMYLMAGHQSATTTGFTTGQPSCTSCPLVLGADAIGGPFFSGLLSDIQFYENTPGLAALNHLLRGLDVGRIGDYALRQSSYTDHSPQGNTLSDSGGVTAVPDQYGTPGNAANLPSGTTNLTAGDPPGYGNLYGLTVTGWVALNDLAAGGAAATDIQHIAIKGSDGDQGATLGNSFEVLWDARGPGGGVGNQFAFVVRDGTQTAYTASKTSFGQSLEVGEYFHFAGIWDGQEVVLYINGAEADRQPAAFGPLFSSASDLYIGSSQSGYAAPGSYSDFRIFDRPLNQREVQALAATTTDGLMARFSLNNSLEDGSLNHGDASGGGSLQYGTVNSPRILASNGVLMDGDTTDYISTLVDWSPANAPRGGFAGWVRADTMLAGYDQTVISINDGGQDRALYIPSGGDQWAIGTQGATHTFPEPVSQGEWTHLALNYGNGDAILYINGRPYPFSGTGATTTAILLHLGVAADQAGSANSFNGMFSGFRVYNRNLTTGEVRQLSGFHPTQLGRPVLWLKGNTGVLTSGGTAYAANGNTVSNWKNLADDLNHASDADANCDAPVFETGQLNNRPVVTFDGVDDCLTFPNSISFPPNLGGFTVAAVVSSTRTTGGGNDYVLSFGNVSANGMALGYGVDAMSFATPTTPGGVDTGDLVISKNSGDYSILVARVAFNGTQKVYLDGTEIDSSAITLSAMTTGGLILDAATRSIGSGPITVGAQSQTALDAAKFFQGSLAELIWYNAPIEPTGERKQLECYLAEFYGLEGNLPNNHCD